MDSFIQFDGRLLIGIQHALNADWLTPVMKSITMFGEGGCFWIAACILMLCFRKTRRLGIICSAALAFTFLCCNIIIKPIVARPRPWELFEEVVPLLPHPGDTSFPSGHSANSMGTAWALFIATYPVKIKASDGSMIRSYDEVPCLGWKGQGASAKTMHHLGIAAVILAVLIGFSRLYLGMHFPSDVASGLLLGMICATAVWAAITKLEKKRGLIGSIKDQQ
jgi:undecaprenyl-diphosphatase